MEQQQLQFLQKTLDDIRHQNGVEFWYARELYPILGYVRWENFVSVLDKAKEACANSKGVVEDHFRDVTKMVKMGVDNSVEREIYDVKLTRYACYLITLNGDPKKEAVAFAQAYFVTQTRTLEVLQERMAELERLEAREKLKITEKEFGATAFGRGVDSKGIALIKSAGDKALFGGRSTEDMKNKLSVPKSRPLADFLPNVTLKAKDLATAMTIENTRRKNLQGTNYIYDEHVSTNQSVRGALVQTGINPESLPASEDLRLIEARHRKEMKELAKKQKEEIEQATKKMLRSK